VHRDHGSGHHRDQHRCGERGKQAEGEQRAAEELGRPGDAGVQPAGPEADVVEHPGGALQPAATEDAEQLLGAVADEEQSHHQANHKQCEIHGDPPRSRSGALRR
jgi:hypothetical protein